MCDVCAMCLCVLCDARVSFLSLWFLFFVLGTENNAVCTFKTLPCVLSKRSRALSQLSESRRDQRTCHPSTSSKYQRSRRPLFEFPPLGQFRALRAQLVILSHRSLACVSISTTLRFRAEIKTLGYLQRESWLLLPFVRACLKFSPR